MNLACQTYWAWTIQQGFQHHYWAPILNHTCYKYWVCTLEYVSCHYWDWSLEVKYCNYWASILVHTFCHYWTYALKQVCCNHWDSTVEHTCHHSRNQVMEYMTCNHWPCSLTMPAASISITLLKLPSRARVPQLLNLQGFCKSLACCFIHTYGHYSTCTLDQVCLKNYRTVTLKHNSCCNWACTPVERSELEHWSTWFITTEHMHRYIHAAPMEPVPGTGMPVPLAICNCCACYLDCQVTMA